MNTKSIQQRFYRIRSNRSFELFVVIIIMFSALMIGAKTYDLPNYVLAVIHWLDCGITLFFLIEISIRFLGEERKRDFFKSGWNLFDTLIVTVSLIPADGSSVAIVGRLIRIFRVLRMVSIIPELRMLLNSLLRALPQLGYVVMLMFIIFYIYAAIGTTFYADINEVLWGDIAISMLTLFRVMTFEDWTDVMYEAMEVHWWAWIYFLTFIFFTAFAFLNMVIGIVVNAMHEEHEKTIAQTCENDALQETVSLESLQRDIQELKVLILKKQSAD
ncbi:MAG: ion transporter [gamma proteobacterium symbiont of Bathyaustriella thionipta]|nr:ion transporter [gamma proteobacterium symbiont of Bathyaustriella thionipta]